MGSSNADGGGAVLLPLTDPAWMSFVEGHPEATPFHHPAWANVLARAYRFESCGLALVAGDGEIEAALPLIRLGGRASRRRAVSLPFTDWCPPLLAPDADRERLGERLERARHGTGVGSLEVRDELARRRRVRPGPGLPARPGARARRGRAARQRRQEDPVHGP